MAIKTWSHYFVDKTSTGQANETFQGLSNASQEIFLAIRAYETENMEYFFSEQGIPIQHQIDALPVDVRTQLMEQHQTPRFIALGAQSPPQQQPISPSPFQPYQPPFSGPPQTWHYPDPDSQAMAHKQALQLHMEKLRLEAQFKEQFELQKVHFATLVKTVPIFNRERDAISLFNFLEKFQRALAGPYLHASQEQRIEFLESKLSAAATTWYKNLQPPPNADVQWFIHILTKDHEPSQDEVQARTALRKRKLSEWPASDSQSFANFTAVFDSFLPRLREMDRITKIETFSLCVGEPFYLEISKQISSKGINKPTYDDFKHTGQTLWTMGVRPTPAKTVPLVTPSPNPSNKAPTFPTHLKKLFSAPTQMARVSMDSWTQEQKDLYRSKACFHCKQPGHFDKNCKSRPLQTILQFFQSQPIWENLPIHLRQNPR